SSSRMVTRARRADEGRTGSSRLTFPCSSMIASTVRIMLIASLLPSVTDCPQLQQRLGSLGREPIGEDQDAVFVCEPHVFQPIGGHSVAKQTRRQRARRTV